MARKSFPQALSDAIGHYVKNGYDDQHALESWVASLKSHLLAEIKSPEQIEKDVRVSLGLLFDSLITKGGVVKKMPGVSKFTLNNIRVDLRQELNRRILASANLIKLNREAQIDNTLRRFQGWATSIPPGGARSVDKRNIKMDIAKGVKRLSFEERRVQIDQGAKLSSSIHDIVAKQGGAIAVKWHSHFRQIGYDYREDHKKRDGKIYLMRDSWAKSKGLVKPGEAGYIDEVTFFNEEPFCRCSGKYIFNIEDIPEDMLTAKGKAAIATITK
jgi:hypothetical protein